MPNAPYKRPPFKVPPFKTATINKPFKSTPFKEPPFSVTVIITKVSLSPIQIKYIWMFVQVKRNGEIIHYATSYTPFRTERAIQP